MTQAPVNSWIHFFSNNPSAKLRLFCFHYAGGNAYIFSDWVKSIPADIELCAIQLPGRMNLLNLTPLQQFDNVIKPLCDQLLPYLREKPFVFFGHSLGALISHSLSHYLLENYSLTPSLLLIAACASPSIRKRGEPIYLLPDNEFLEKLSAYNNSQNNNMHQLMQNNEFMQFMMPILRADFSLSATYNYIKRQPLDIPIVAYGGSQDLQVLPDEIKAWNIETTKSFSYSIFDGDHFFIKNQQANFLETLVNDLKVSN